jgi:L-alanine-DL-glutamate epimerase-like enolase superfamily enzyme
MKINRLLTWKEHLPLTRPYTIAYHSVDSVSNWIVELHTDTGFIGYGAASPSEYVTGETESACAAALSQDHLAWLLGSDPRELPRLCRKLNDRLAATPAARAAVDMALHDLLAQHLELPLVRMLGQAHERLPTSITIGIKSVAETLEEADEYLGRGFRMLKVKLGMNLEEDIERLSKLREGVGAGIGIRVDPNQGYSVSDVERFITATADLDIEFLEQPMAAADIDAMRQLPAVVRRCLAADESLLNERDALHLLNPSPACGIFNIKLMKCGGIRPAQRIATFAETAGIELMWGCMDESIISISAALHTALASPATAYLDLDGSFDLARDVVSGGFTVNNGYLTPCDQPGLGLQRTIRP